MTYKEALDWLYSTQTFGIKLGLDNPKELLRKFLAFPSYNTKVIHAAGTNGKGSTCAIMELLVRGAGMRTGLFTSPHLVHYRERIRVNGVMIGEEQCAKYLTDLRVIAEKMAHHPTFFELSLAVAMRYYKDQGVEVIILETGMGGRLDATTAVPADVCVITPIAMDHSQWLGETLEEVAKEKAGIMLQGVPVIASPQELDAKIVLLEEANEIRCPITIIEEPLKGYSVNIPGEHQKYNANVAVQAVHEAGISLNYDNVKFSLENVYWPGRFEQIGDDENPIILDGAHNPQAAEALEKTWNFEYPDQPATLIFGAVDCKDITNVLTHCKNISKNIILTPIDSPRTLPLAELRKGLGDFEAVQEADDVADAIAKAKEAGGPILIAGSLFLIGQVKAMIEDGKFERSAQ